MKEYIWRGVILVESGEERAPRNGEWFLSNSGNPLKEGEDGAFNAHPVSTGTRKILIPKESKVQDEYNIPVLVKAQPGWIGAASSLQGRVHLMRRDGDRLYGPKASEGDLQPWRDGQDGIVVYPTRFECEAEAAKLNPPKPDPLPAPVRDFLAKSHPGICNDAKRFAESFARVLFENLPKASA